MRDDLAKENDTTNTLLQELQDTRNQVRLKMYIWISSDQFIKSFDILSLLIESLQLQIYSEI